MSKVSRINVEGQDYELLSGGAVRGACASNAADWTKIVLLADGTELLDGLFMVVAFADGNTVGFAKPTIVYSSDGENFYLDPEETDPITLPPAANYTATLVSGNEYSLEEYPVLSINNTLYPVCDALGHLCGGSELWSAGDTVVILFTNGRCQILSVGGSGSGSGVPVGSVISMYTNIAPSSEWLLCDGSTFDQSAYPALYMYLGSNKLPDLREAAIVGAGKNETYVFDSTETDPSTGNAGTQDHDVYALGEFKDDQMQHLHGSIVGMAGRYDSSTYQNVSVVGSDNNLVKSGANVSRNGFSNSGTYSVARINIDNSIGARTGYDYDNNILVGSDVTRGKRFALNFFIKATITSNDSDYEGTLEAIREYVKNNSVPLGTWVSFESGVAPGPSYLEAGATFNADIYPALAMMLGGTVVPERFDHSQLGGMEDISIPESSATHLTVPYDGFIILQNKANNQSYIYIKTPNSVVRTYVFSNSSSYYQNTIPVRKGDEVYRIGSFGSASVRYYKKHLFIKATVASDDGDYEGTLNTIRTYVRNSNSYSVTEKPTGGYWTDGRPIYQRTYTGLTVKATATTIDTLTNVSKFIKSEFLVTIYTDSNQSTVNSYDTSASAAYSWYVRLLPNGQLRGYSGNAVVRITDVTIWYTKTTDTPST